MGSNIMNRKSAFTMIELLTVIAIIAILAAILFPVYARVKDSAYRSSDQSHMNAIRTALQLYRADQGAYPPQLIGYVTLYTSGVNMGNVIPADVLVGPLFPKRVESIDTFRPAYVRGAEASPIGQTGAVWPTVDSAHYGGIDNSPLQRYGPMDAVINPATNMPANYYSISGYDTALVKVPTGSERELRYTLFWSGYGLKNGDPTDSPRQLGYTDPPDTTVITWDSYFREYDSAGNVAPGEKRDIILFLGGSARQYDSTIIAADAWQTSP